MAERCPICGGEIVLGECSGCGFEPPDYSAIAAPYDLDPSNDRFGEEDSVEGLFPHIDTAGISDSPEYDIPSIALPNVPSANSLGKLASVSVQPLPNIRVRPAVQSAKAANANSPPSVQTFQQSPTAQPAQPLQSVQSMQLMQPQASPAVKLVKAVSDFVTKHWYKLLATLIAPTAGILIGAFYLFIFSCMRDCKKYGDLFKGILFGTAGMLLLLEGFDPIGIDAVLRQILSIFFDN